MKKKKSIFDDVVFKKLPSGMWACEHRTHFCIPGVGRSKSAARRDYNEEVEFMPILGPLK